MKRQRGRNRGGGGGGGGGKPQQNANRAFDSNGPDGVKVRGNAQHVFEKYQQLARDASSSGDRVLAENYLQHAEHYFRLIRALQPSRPASEIIGRDHFTSGFDIDFEDEGLQAQAEAADEAAGEAAEARGGDDGEFRGRDDRARDDRPRDDRPRDDRPRDERPRDDRNRDDRNRDDRNRDRGDWQPRDGEGRRDRWRERDRNNRNRDDRPRAEGDDRRERFDRQDRGERPERDPLAVVQPQGQDLAREERAPAAPMLRDAEGGASQAPAFLQPTRPPAAAPAPVEAAEEKPARPRRRRAPRSFEGGEGEPAKATETED